MPMAHTLRQRLLNALPNVMWTALCAGPLYLFCARHMNGRDCIYLSAAASLLLMLPKSALRRLQLSRNPRVYRSLRVHWLIPFTQDSGWMRRLAGDPPLPLPRQRPCVKKLIADTRLRERFHLALLLFFLLCALTALLQRRFAWAALLMLLNIAYNLYPVWLQQFLRMRFERLLR